MIEKRRYDLLREFPLKWALCWVVIPNLAIIAMWPIGGPTMASVIFYCGLIALLVSQRSNALWRVVGVVAMFTITITAYVTKSFNIDVQNIFRAAEYLGELRISQSPEYIVAFLFLLISLGAAFYFCSRTPVIKSRAQILLALAGVSMVVNIDTVATAGTQGSYKASAPRGAPIDSAILQTRLSPRTVAARNLVVILVESWGVPDNGYDRALDHQVWRPERWDARYAVSNGGTAYYGSTTNAEVREWCGAWADHDSFDFDRSHCLPERFRDAGFATFAMHSFNGEFFDRETWYPKIGFQHVAFGDTLMANGARFCDGVFPGACDHDVPAQIGKVLRTSRSDRNLVYWLTVNSHLPVDSSRALGTDPCLLGTHEWRENFPMLCRSYQVQQHLADAITAEIMQNDFPEADILIVGDHMPPFFPRNIRTRFDNGRVPYFYLENRAARAKAQARAAERPTAGV